MCIPSIRVCRNGYGPFAEKYPDDCWLKGSAEDGSETYMIRKGRLSLKLVPPYSTSRKMQAKDISKMKELS